MATALVILIIQDGQGQRHYRAFSAHNSERPLDLLMRDVQLREGINEGMAIRWRNGEGYIVETHGLMSTLSHGNREDNLWVAVRPNGGIAHDVPAAHTQDAILAAIQQRGQGWQAVSAIHAFIHPA
jgi:hypothetical protein